MFGSKCVGVNIFSKEILEVQLVASKQIGANKFGGQQNCGKGKIKWRQLYIRNKQEPA
jgi:hypothetical protein